MIRIITDGLIHFGILKQKYYASYYAFGKIQYSVELGNLTASELKFIKEKKFVDEKDGREYPIVLHAGFEAPGERFSHKLAIERVEKERIGESNNPLLALFLCQKAAMDMIEMRGQAELRLAKIPRKVIAWFFSIVGFVAGSVTTFLLTRFFG